ncbi:hypothetical protein DL98DRAFT_589819 [Cadophora sp. DSE1049]|nr:hypothetical protein DL98DRAFT_589819 [Cadophora sp. DSE1049]
MSHRVSYTAIIYRIALVMIDSYVPVEAATTGMPLCFSICVNLLPAFLPNTKDIYTPGAQPDSTPSPSPKNAHANDKPAHQVSPTTANGKHQTHSPSPISSPRSTDPVFSQTMLRYYKRADESPQHTCVYFRLCVELSERFDGVDVGEMGIVLSPAIEAIEKLADDGIS